MLNDLDNRLKVIAAQQDLILKNLADVLRLVKPEENDGSQGQGSALLAVQQDVAALKSKLNEMADQQKTIFDMIDKITKITLLKVPDLQY